MKSIFGTIALPILAMGMLSGCQSLSFGNHRAAASETGEVDIGAYFVRRLEDGRRDLQANRFASAITAFRQASYDPDLAAASYNGMAIAYERLGRSDLAERYFLSAMQRDPADSRYSRNFALFSERHFGDVPEALALAYAEQEAAANSLSSPPQTEEPAIPASRLRRISAREVHVGSNSGTAAPPATRNMPTQAINVQERIVAAERSNAYPVRVNLSLSSGARRFVHAQERATIEQSRRRLADLRASRRETEYPISIALSDGTS